MKILKSILNHDLITIQLVEKSKGSQIEHQVLIKTESGAWLEHHPFTGDLKGLINAMDLAINVMSGKFWIRAVHTTSTQLSIPSISSFPKEEKNAIRQNNTD